MPSKQGADSRDAHFIAHHPSPIFEVDTEGRYTYFNEAAASLAESSGFKHQEVYGTTYLDYMPDEEKPKATGKFYNALKGEAQSYSTILLTAQGQRMYAMVHLVPRWQEGEVKSVICQLHDISERVQEQHQLQTLMGNLPGFIGRFRNTPGWPIDYIKGAPEVLLGYTEQDLKQEDFFNNLIHPKDRDYVWNEAQRQLARGNTYSLVYRMLAKNGEPQWVLELGQWVVDPFTAEEKLESLFIDFSDQKAKEAELTRLLEEKQALLAEVHHRVKNNLAIISGMMQLQLDREKDRTLRGRLIESVNRIHAMASIHEQLYKGNTLSRLDFTKHLQQLVRDVVISLQDHILHLTIEDNGIGISGNSDRKEGDSLGMQIIDSLAHQLRAGYEYRASETGTLFSIRLDNQAFPGDNDSGV